MEKAAAAEKFKELVQNAVYAFSAEHDVHSEEGKKVEAKLWDYFVSSVKAGNATTPVILSVRSIDRDTRAQIYAVNTEIEAATSRGDGHQGKPVGRLPSYGGFTTSNGDKLSQKEGNVNKEYSYKSDYEDYLNALEQDDEGTKSNFASNKPAPQTVLIQRRKKPQLPKKTASWFKTWYMRSVPSMTFTAKRERKLRLSFGITLCLLLGWEIPQRR